MPPFNRNHPQCFFHSGVGNGDDSTRKIARISKAALPATSPLPPSSEEVLETLFRRLFIKGELSTQEAFRVQTAKEQMGIRHGGRRASPAVTDRAGNRAGALGTHAKSAARIEACQRPSARTYRVDVEDRDGNRQITQRRLMGRAGSPVEQTDIG